MDQDQAAAAGGGIAIMLFYLVAWVVGGFIVGKIFQKAGKPLWAGWVPIYNYVVLLEIIGRPIWWVVLFFIPFVNFVVLILVMIDLAKAFGKDTLYGILLLIPCVNVVMLLMLAFGDASYVGPPNNPAGA